jgi:polyisoprenoid-binding protein YceI
MKLLLSGLIVFLLWAAPAHAVSWQIDQAQSSVTFSGTHAGQKFTGKFENWDATINFDPANPSAGSISANFTVASAKTGNAMYDGTLPQADWFDAKNHPQASFTSTAISASKILHNYNVVGNLTLRGVTKPANFIFTLQDPAAVTAKATASFPIDRLAFDIGRKSDVKAEWVSQTIDLTLTLVASRKP